MCNELIEGDELNAAFNKIGAKRVVMGHTTAVTRQVQQRMGGRVIEIDTGMLTATYRGSGNALVIEGDKVSVVNQRGKAKLSPIEHPLRVGHESLAVDEDGMADILLNGDILELTSDEAAWRLVQVSTDEYAVFAYFRELPAGERFVPELAAFKLDRMLRLGMVPVTVRREFDGQSGTLQFVPTDGISERKRTVTGTGTSMYCSLDKQIGAMHVFDALIHNSSRSPSSMLYSPDDWLLLLIDHANSFTTNDERPAHLKNIDLAVGEQWRTALQELDDKTLREELADVLDQQRLVALSNRRDALISNSGN